MVTKEQSAQLYELCLRLFHDKFCPAHGVGERQKPLVSPLVFSGWLSTLFSEGDNYELRAEFDVDLELWEILGTIVQGGQFIVSFMDVWLRLTMARREKEKHELETINVAFLATWADGRTALVHSVTPFQPGTQVDDIVVLNILREASGNIFNGIATRGLSELAAPPPSPSVNGVDPFVEFMKVLQTQTLPAMPEHLRAACEGYVALFHKLVRPTLSPPIMAAYEQVARKAEEEAKRDAGEWVEVRGGWDVP